MDITYNNIKWLISIVAGWLASFCNQYGMLSLLVCGAIVFDIVTGILKAKTSKTLNSNTGFVGFWKKLSLLFGLFFGYFLDFFEYYLLSVSGTVDFAFHIPFGTTIGIYIVLNECISIVENLYACGVKLPKFLIKALKAASEQADRDDFSK